MIASSRLKSMVFFPKNEFNAIIPTLNIDLGNSTQCFVLCEFYIKTNINFMYYMYVYGKVERLLAVCA